MKIQLKLTQKIMLMIFCLLVLSITGIAIISVSQSDKYLTTKLSELM